MTNDVKALGPSRRLTIKAAAPRRLAQAEARRTRGRQNEDALPQEIQGRIAGWLQAGRSTCSIGYEAGSRAAARHAAFIREPRNCARLITYLREQPATFLQNYRGKKVGIMVKGCDARAIVGLMQEGQWARENLRIVGVACPGVVDPRKVACALGVAVDELEDVCLDGERIAVDGHVLALDDMLHDTCASCPAYPGVHDTLFGAFDG